MATQHLSPVPPAPVMSHAYPMANAGYGKRNAPDQSPSARDDFALLPARERYVAGFVDRLPEGAVMSVKQLAKHLPLYGQQAISTSLNSLSVAGHLRRIRSRRIAGTGAGTGGEVRWTFRTFWSRTARDNEWWNAYLATECAMQAAALVTPSVPARSCAQPVNAPTSWGPVEEPQQQRQPTPPVRPIGTVPDRASEPAPVPQQRAPLPAPDVPRQHHAEQPLPPQRVTPSVPHRGAGHAPPARAAAPAAPASSGPALPAVSALPDAPVEIPAALCPASEPGLSDAYLALARLGRDDHRLALSAADCAILEPLASAWLARGVSVDYLTSALTAGLPARIDFPAGLLHRRLTDKIPPRLPREVEGRSPGATEPINEALVECTNCRQPGPSEALPGGLCRPCHHAHTHGGEPTAPTPDEVAAVKAHIANLRNLLKPV
ncbi:MarR family transcriptional regulator [Streptomyces californicus]|uniref:MarR family transcriptional regulator n=1 Tax=Streptomyces californicus TaxID=67351 RepID=UPI00381E4277